MYSLSDYIIEDENGNAKKVRNDATYNKDYLTGRYGAIPVLEEFDILSIRINSFFNNFFKITYNIFTIVLQNDKI